MVTHRPLAAILAGCLALVPAIAAARTTVMLEPASDWILSERPTSCAVSRMFEADKKKVMLQLENANFGSGFRVSVLTDDYKLSGLGVTTGFLPGEPVNWGLPLHIKLPDGKKGVMFDAGVMIGTPAAQLNSIQPGGGTDNGTTKTLDALARQRELEVDRLLVGDVFSRNLVLHTGSMRPPMVVMRMCSAELARKLGIDPEKADANIVGPRLENPETFLQHVAQNYPEEYRFSGKNARVRLELKIDAKGNVTNCMMQQDYGPHEFASPACRFALKEKFLPAIDAKGQPTSSIFLTTINY